MSYISSLNRIRKKYSPLVLGTFTLTFAGLIAKVLGFIYRIALARYISTESLGIYQVVQPLTGIIFSLCCVGFQSAISKYTAADKKGGCIWLLCALLQSMVLSVAAMILTNHFAQIIATRFLLFSDAAQCVRLIAWSFPFIALHNCFAGYYYGQEKTLVPAVSQIAEQAARIITLFICFYVIRKSGVTFEPHHAIIGNIAGEIASCATFLSVSRINFVRSLNLGLFIDSMKKTFFYSLPISVNSLLVHLFQSAEAVLIPAQLILSGKTSSDALELYGILSGMVLPLITLPSVFTGSLAVLIIPSVAKSHESSKETIDKTIRICLSLGIFSVFVYGTLLADIAGNMYNEPLAATFTRILAWLCPFMYLTQTMSGILNGAGKTTSTCIQNTLGIVMRLAALIIAVPKYGITAYMISLLISKIVICIIQYIQITRTFHIKPAIGTCILHSAFMSAVSVGAALIIRAAATAIHTADASSFSLLENVVLLCVSTLIFLILFKRTAKNQPL